MNLKREVSNLKDNLNRETNRSRSVQDDLESMRRKLEREKGLLEEDNKRLGLEADKVRN